MEEYERTELEQESDEEIEESAEEEALPAGVEHQLAENPTPAADGLGLDGSTPEGGIQGRLTQAGSHRESERNERDWQVHVEVDQPVQSPED